MGLAGDSLLFEGWLQGSDATKLLIALLPVWILGAVIGMLVRFPYCRTSSFSAVSALVVEHVLLFWLITSHGLSNAATTASLAGNKHTLWRLLVVKSVWRAIASFRSGGPWLCDR